MNRPNVLFLMTDEHARDASGCYGHPLAQTPAIDGLARSGTRFINAITPSPICVPARAALATGRYVHECGNWCNALPYRGDTPSWHHRLRDAGYEVSSVGKLHFRSSDDDNGFVEEIEPLHVRGGQGWVRGLLRIDPPPFESARDFATDVGAGECEYTAYDRRVRDAAVSFIGRAARTRRATPWALFVSFVSPHYPLVVPSEHFSLYPQEQVGDPRLGGPGERPRHPVVRGVASFMNYDDHFADARSRRVARAAYLGLCTFVDGLVGDVLAALDQSGQRADTLVIYTSDHGEMLGNHGLWTKCVMFEESVNVPLIVAGPGFAEGASCAGPASLVDCYPTILESSGIGLESAEQSLPGQSLRALSAGEGLPRTLLAEYHDGGSPTGMFMIRVNEYKYVHYPGYPPELYDLVADPWESDDLTGREGHAPTVRRCEARLRGIVDPDEVNRQAFADQAARIADLGGRDAILAMDDYDHTPVPRDARRQPEPAPPPEAG